ncbi:MAG: MBOAT family protein [Betaproteobacteria bacterium]|nr:MBOAT family protein [Betaproteobacteria bacterium]
MLFNSYVFIFAFLPVTLAGFFLLGRVRPLLAAAWLTAASLIFYGWWNPLYVWLLVASILFNYACGVTIARNRARGEQASQKRWLIFAVTANLAVLGYYKYANFFLASISHFSGAALSFGEIVLPLGISFFTFTQIAFLADTYYGKAREYNFVHYSLFVTYFPHLIAGPVLHHAEMMPQFGLPITYRFSFENTAVGITIFVIGLFKKVMIADEVGAYARPVFDAAAAGAELTLLEAWCGALAYTFQLYFDFSGYSDMAIGLSRLFGVVLPLNFHSPYKAVNIIDFWRRWHMTLSRFLRDYLYIPLGGNRKGAARRYVNLMLTMALGGLWHGAGWTFVAWGALHGGYLVVNHGWRALRARLGHDLKRSTWWGRACAGLLTFVAVVLGWVIFRAADLTAAVAMLKAMAGMNGLVLPDFWLPQWGAAGQWLAAHGVIFGDTRDLVGGGVVNWIWILLAVVWFAPNTQQLLAAYRPALALLADQYHARFTWRPTPFYALLTATLALLAIFNLHRQSEFLYFQF